MVDQLHSVAAITAKERLNVQTPPASALPSFVRVRACACACAIGTHRLVSTKRGDGGSVYDFSGERAAATRWPDIHDEAVRIRVLLRHDRWSCFAARRICCVQSVCGFPNHEGLVIFAGRKMCCGFHRCSGSVWSAERVDVRSTCALRALGCVVVRLVLWEQRLGAREHRLHTRQQAARDRVCTHRGAHVT